MQKMLNIAGKLPVIIVVLFACALGFAGSGLAQTSPLEQPYAAQPAAPAQQAVPPQQAAPACVYPNGASCPMAMAATPGMSCACQQSWAGTGVVANGAANAVPPQPGAAAAPGSTAAAAQQTLQTPPPPANMVPIQ